MNIGTTLVIVSDREDLDWCHGLPIGTRVTVVGPGPANHPDWLKVGIPTECQIPGLKGDDWRYVEPSDVAAASEPTVTEETTL